MGDELDLRARMRLGVSGALQRLGGARRVSGVSLVALLCASALAPVVAAGVAVGPVALASLGMVGAVGVDVLADVVKAAVGRLRREGGQVSQASVEAELATMLEEALESQGESASALREAVAGVLRGVDAVGALMEAAAARDQDLLPTVVEGFASLGERFSEFEFVVDDVRHAVWAIEVSLRQQQAAWRVEQERAREHDLTLLRVLEVVERGGVSAAHRGGAGNGDPVWPGCPYLGLMPFDERDARLFYGRSELTGQLLQRLSERLASGGLLLVAGESGVGKSSLLRAGIMPRLAAGVLGPGSEKWPRRVLRPTGSPMRELAMHLADLAALDPVSVYQSLSVSPGEAPLLIERVVKRAMSPGHGGARGLADDAVMPPRLVLVVDQLEELFTAGEASDAGWAERKAFVAALHAAATVPAGTQGVPAALVVVVVRADLFGRVTVYPPLKAAVDAGPFVVGAMSEAELRLAISGPASEADLTVEPALVETVVSELRGDGPAGGLDSGALPLMSQAMAATWERREGNKMSLRAYRRAGGVADAINRSAQEAYDTLTTQQQDAARFVFTRLTVVTPDGQLARRRCSHADLRTSATQAADDIDAVIDIFSDRRLLVLGDDSVEISHDALLHAWKQLRDWLAEDQLDRALYSQIVTDAQAWEANRRSASFLYRPGRLATIDAAISNWVKSPASYPPLPPTSTAFLDAAHRAARRATRWQQAVISGLLTLSLTAMAAAGIAAHNGAIANRQHNIALSRQLAAESLNIDPTAPVVARRLAVAAWRVFASDQAGSVITTLLTEQQENGILPAGTGTPPTVNAVAFSPHGKLLATANQDGTVRLWDPATGQPVRSLYPSGPRSYDRSYIAHVSSGVDAVAFSPGGRLLAVGDQDGTVRLWDPATGQPIRVLHAPGSTNSVDAVAFSPHGKLLASADLDGTVRLWDLATGQQVRVLHVPSPPVVTKGVDAVAFSSNGRLLASTDGGGTVRLWNPATGQQVRVLRASGSTFGVYGVALSSNGKLLASTDGDGTVRLWDPATGQPVRVLHIPAVSATSFTDGGSVAFSPDGKLLASTDWDGTVRLWNPATGQPPGAALSTSATAALGGVSGVAFSPHGKLLASADQDGTVRLWDPATGQPVRFLQATSNHHGGVWGVAFSRNGKLLASTDWDGTVRLWNPATGQALGAPFGPSNGMSGSAVEFSPDGKLLATANGDGTVRLWDPATTRLIRVLHAASGPLGYPVAFSPDGKLLATAGNRGTVRLWNPATGRLVRTLYATSSTDNVDAVAFSPGGKLLATANGDGTMRLWNPATGHALGTSFGPVNARSLGSTMAFSPNGKLLATANGDGTMRLWNSSIFSNPYAALCADVGPPTQYDWKQYAAGEPQPSACTGPAG